MWADARAHAVDQDLEGESQLRAHWGIRITNITDYYFPI